MEKDYILQMLSVAADDIFLELQRKHGIKSGDVEPLDEIMLTEATEKLADTIVAILKKQK